jgi:hypothetical protein
MQNPSDKPTTYQKDLTKLPRALAPLIERPQWCNWRWTQQQNGRWQKPPFMARAPQQHASTSDPSTWSDYGTAVATAKAGDADGITYVLTENDPFAAIDLDHCRDIRTCSIDVWAQNFLDVGRHSYSEITPSGNGCRIWGLADGGSLHKKFSLVIDNKEVAVELFRRTRKALTITGYRLDTIRELTNIDRAIDWGITWAERRKAAALEVAAPLSGNGFDGSGCKYSVDQIEQMVRNGAPDGANRSDVFHTVVGHYLGCGGTAEQIYEHLQQFPNGIAERYLHEERLGGEIARSIGKFGACDELPPFETNGGWADSWETKAPEPEKSELPPWQEEPQPKPEIDDDESSEDDADLDDDGLDEDEPPTDSKLPPLHAHGDADPRPLKNWLVKHLIPACGHGLLSGQWGTGKTFVVFDLFAALAAQQPFLGHAVKRQCGMLLIAAEGADDVRLRLDAVVRTKCGGMVRAPVRWYETAPMLLHKGSVDTLIAMAQQAEQSLQDEFGLPLGLIIIDTVAACAGYRRAGEENDPAVGQAVMNALKMLAQAANCFVLGVDHFGKSMEAGTRGASSKEASGDLVLACLGDKQLSGSVINTRVAVRKHRGGRQGEEFPFLLRAVEAPERDEDGEPITTMVVDWVPPGSAGAAPAAEDSWIAECRQEEQRVGMSRLKRVLMAALAEHGAEREIPSATGVRNSDASIGDELRTGVADAPAVRMVAQEIVQEAFYLCTPEDPKQTQHSRFARARDRAESRGLIQAANIDGVTYLWLTRPDPQMDEGD